MDVAAPIRRAFSSVTDFMRFDRSNGYDAIEDRKRRKAPRSVLRTEDKELDATGRRKLVATTRDVQRNFELAAWALRKHLDYVSTFAFKAGTNQEPFDTKLERLVVAWSKADAFDIAGRHSRRSFTRMCEARRTIDGDVAVMKLASGHVQGIEGDRIRTPDLGSIPEGIDTTRLIHGVLVNQGGRAVAYALCDRTDGGFFSFARMIPARNLFLHAYFDRFDQTRGISPLAPAINRFQDTYESLEYALLKAKAAQMFALATFRAPEEEEAVGDITTTTDEAGAIVKAETTQKLPGAPIHLDFTTGEDAKFLESHSPSTEFQQFTEVSIRLVLKAFDIPYTYYDSRGATFSSDRKEILLYEQSAEAKRESNQDLLDDWLSWRLTLAVLDGEIALPPGWTVPDVVAACEWIPKCLPWIDPLKEVKADREAVAGSFTSTPRVCKRMGLDAYQIVDEEAEFQQYRREKLGDLMPKPPTYGTEDKDDEKEEVAGGK